MDKDIEKFTTLEELFNKWRTEKGHEFFCKDGFIDEDTFKKQEKKILFIAKESNISVDDYKEDYYWLQSVVHGDSVPKISSRRILIMTNALFSDDFDTVKKDPKGYNILEKIAYMNINKCGGGSRSKDNELEEYAKTYKEYIEKEINIINPDLIVCGSSIVHNIVGGIVERKNDRPYLVEVYHPSYYRISDKEYLKRFYNELKNIQKN